MASMDSFDICTSRNDFYLLAGAMRSFFTVIATHLLAGEVDTSTLSQEAPMLPRLLWLLRYFNPLNLSWRYYSIFAYRLVVGRKWGEKQMAIINFEAHPLRPPKPFVVTEAIDLYHVRRLDPSGFFSSQGLLTISAGYQAILAVQYTIWTAGVAFLPNITMPLAIIGLFRVLVYPWITGKVYVDPYPYLSSQIMESMPVTPHKANKLVASAWFLVVSFLFFLSVWSFFEYPAVNLPKQKLQLTVQVFYLYTTTSQIISHSFLLWQGTRAWCNRVLFFDHWLYKAQTLVFMSLLACSFILGVSDFIEHDFYRECM
ncbi:hypothetical protein KP509_07G083000 [Ceratopteris richardii]|uniref:Uncharacterized protein n=1 Tax=Ceratopteris richardii TaxID=49495 RepID=A0A8T2UK46_CERRI|nr:hypothetical protein KP509_07G083000 [Ceratopteris richardii]